MLNATASPSRMPVTQKVATRARSRSGQGSRPWGSGLAAVASKRPAASGSRMAQGAPWTRRGLGTAARHRRLRVDVSADLLLTTVELYRKIWKLAAFEYGSNLTFGLVFPIHYESGKPFDLSFADVQWKYPHIDSGEVVGGLVKQLVG